MTGRKKVENRWCGLRVLRYTPTLALTSSVSGQERLCRASLKTDCVKQRVVVLTSSRVVLRR